MHVHVMTIKEKEAMDLKEDGQCVEDWEGEEKLCNHIIISEDKNKISSCAS